MTYYFFQNQILFYDADISSAVDTSTDFNDQFNKHVPLTDAQVEFFEANSKASIYEVRDCQLSEPVIPSEPTTDELRERAFAFEPLINWKEKYITVDEANRLYLYYRAEADETTAAELQALIKSSKESIRERYPK